MTKTGYKQTREHITNVIQGKLENGGYKHSEETKQNMRHSHKPISEEGKKNMSGRIISEETRNKISIANRGHIMSEEQKKRMSNRMKGGNATSFKKGLIPWSKGLTKDNNDSLKRISEKMSERMKDLSEKGIIKEWNSKKRIHLDKKLLYKLYFKENKSTNDIAKELGVSSGLIIKNMKEGGYKLRERNDMTDVRRLKSSNNTKLGMDNEDVKKKVKINRAKQIFPVKDTKIEVKIQNFLKQLNIDFLTHQYIKDIEHGYQCDILIPSMNLVIECDGDYWHKYPIGNDIDHIRTSELLEKGFKVLRLWEFEIKKMELNEFKGMLK